MKSIRIEHVGDINFYYPYLEVFIGNSTNPFLEIGIKENKELCFKFYEFKYEIELSLEEMGNIIAAANDFLSQTLKDKNDVNNKSR